MFFFFEFYNFVLLLIYTETTFRWSIFRLRFYSWHFFNVGTVWTRDKKIKKNISEYLTYIPV